MESLKIERSKAVGHLQLLWWWCIDYAPLGNLSAYSSSQIAKACDWHQEDGRRFVEALVESGFLEKNGEGNLVVHDWMDFCGKLMEQRIERLKIKREYLSLKKSQNALNKTLPTVPNRTVPINTMSGCARRLLAFLNEKAKRRYPESEVNLGFIVARIKEGATEGQCMQVIARKIRDWGGDEKMNKYLRPATLFNKTKWSQYVGELGGN